MLKKSLVIALLFICSSGVFAFTSNFSSHDLTAMLDTASFSIALSATAAAPEFETESMMFFSLGVMGVIAFRRIRNN